MLYEAATGKKPNLQYLRPWGSKVWVRVESGNKLGNCVEEGCWVGIDASSENGCRVYWPLEQKVSVERNVYFDLSAAAPISCEGEEDDFQIPNAIISTHKDSPPASNNTPPQATPKKPLSAITPSKIPVPIRPTTPDPPAK